MRRFGGRPELATRRGTVGRSAGCSSVQLKSSMVGPCGIRVYGPRMNEHYECRIKICLAERVLPAFGAHNPRSNVHNWRRSNWFHSVTWLRDLQNAFHSPVAMRDQSLALQ
jgi:hypothetical protein